MAHLRAWLRGASSEHYRHMGKGTHATRLPHDAGRHIGRDDNLCVEHVACLETIRNYTALGLVELKRG